MAEHDKDAPKADEPAKSAKPAKARGNERPTWAMHDNPANPGKGPGGRRGGGFVQRVKKAHGRGS